MQALQFPAINRGEALAKVAPKFSSRCLIIRATLRESGRKRKTRGSEYRVGIVRAGISAAAEPKKVKTHYRCLCLKLRVCRRDVEDSSALAFDSCVYEKGKLRGKK